MKHFKSPILFSTSLSGYFFPRRKNTNKGQALLVTVFLFTFVSVSLVVGIAAPVTRDITASNNSVYSRASYYLAESGVEDALYRLRNNKQLSASETLVLGANTATTSITTISSSQKSIESTSNYQDRNRKVKAVLITGTGVSFNYGVQVGQGGVIFSNNTSIVGNVYSNGGNLVGANGASVTGSASLANPPALNADFDNSTPSTPTGTVTFANASASQDIAQSFQFTGATSTLSSVSFYIRKTGSPANCTVRLNNETASKPGSTVYATGTLTSSLVTTNLSWVSVTFTSNPIVFTGTNYWIVVDCSTSSSNNYTIGYNSAISSQSYRLGTYNSTWAAAGGNDMYMKVYLGGGYATLSNLSVGSAGVGDVRAHTVTGSTIAGSLYCQSGSGNNKPCNTSQADPSNINFPISDANIQEWKDAASAGTTYSNSSYSYDGISVTAGPAKYLGNVTLTNGAIMTLNGPVWILGTLSLSNNATVKLSSGYGASSGMILAHKIILGNNATLTGSGNSGSYLLAISDYVSSNSSDLGVDISNNVAGKSIIYSPNAYAGFSNNANAKEVMAYGLTLSNNSTVTYETGLASTNFTTGPSGSWDITSWKETQ